MSSYGYATGLGDCGNDDCLDRTFWNADKAFVWEQSSEESVWISDRESKEPGEN
jgi:hypothetical protein